MQTDFPKLQNVPRLLMEAELRPVQGERFQPTGFAHLGPARYQLPNGTEMLLVESAQSVANRMELACCKEDKRTLLDELKGLPYVCSIHNGELLTTSYLEAHRLSSPYLLNTEWAKRLAGEMVLKDDFQLNDQQIYKTLFKYDPCSLLHGVWLSLKQYKDIFSGGRVRVLRSLSGFIEARDIGIAENGGTKFDRNAARTEEEADAKTGYGTLPFPRTEFTAGKITAYFNLDLALLRGYSLGDDATDLLIALVLFKVRRFLSAGLHLRTACDLEVINGLTVTRPKDLTVPEEKDLIEIIKAKIAACKHAGCFADPSVTEIKWQKPRGDTVEIELPVGTPEPTIQDALKQKVEYKKGNKKKGPKLVFKERLNAELVAEVKALFPNTPKVAKALDEKLQKPNTSENADEDETGEDEEK